MTLERINRVESVPFDPEASEANVAQLRAFLDMVQMLIELGKRRAIEMQTDETTTPPTRYLVFEETADAATQGLIDELKGVLDLDPEHSEFRVIRQVTRRQPDEITIRVRSLLTLMGFLARGVELPAEHVEQQRATKIVYPADEKLRSLSVPLQIRSAEDRPDDAFVAVKYEDYWFYIPHSDRASKEAFGLLTYLYQLQSPQAPVTGPLLTLPVS